MVGISVGVVSYGSRGAAIADALARSEYEPNVYIASKQPNPMNIETARRTNGKHIVVPDLSDIKTLSDFFSESDVDFVVPGPEVSIIGGLNNRLGEYGIAALCPASEYALEGSKVRQREILQEVAPGANPRFRVFEVGECSASGVKSWLKELSYQVAIKPDAPGFGKGVGVSGDHFEPTEEGCYRFFMDSLKSMDNGDKLLVEKKVDGEESSFQVFCDGEHIVPVPDTRDYKRAFNGDKGPNTGGMGSYCDVRSWLPFMTDFQERDEEARITQKLFKHLRGDGTNDAIIGVPFYMAFIHTGKGSKVLEVNSRPGDPEILNIMPLIGRDFMDICYAMFDGELDLKSLKLVPKSSVVIYKVPPTYGGKETSYEGSREVDLSKAMKMMEESPDKYRLYPGDMAMEDDRTYAIKSRTVACVGIGDSIEEARKRALEVADSVKGGNLWNRMDIASRKHIGASIKHMEKLRAG